MADEKQRHLQDLLKIHQQRLRQLEKQAASSGISTEPRILTEIDDIRSEIQRIEAELNQLGMVQKPQPKSITSESSPALVSNAIADNEKPFHDDDSTTGVRMTQIQNGIVYFVLTSTGEFVGGVDTLRTVCLRILNGDWEGQVEVHHAFLEGLQHEVDDLLKQPGLTPEEAQKLEQLQPYTRNIARSIEVVRLATKLTFVRAPHRKHTWGVPMNTEQAVGFLTGIFAANDLIPTNSSCTVQCRLYVAKRIKDPVAVNVFLTEQEVKEIQESWERELKSYGESKRNTWEMWGWSTLVPLWHIQDTFIATRLLPAISVILAKEITVTVHETIADTWEQLAQVFPSSEKRDVLVPYDWCLALRSNELMKDLAWRTSPPHIRSEL